MIITKSEPFTKEEIAKLKIIISKLITRMKSDLSRNDEKAAEDALMYSILFQNYALKKLS